MEHEQLRLAPDLLDVMRAGVTTAISRGAPFVAPPHLLLALLDDARIGPAIGELVTRERVEKAAEEALAKLPEVVEVPEAPIMEDEKPAFTRYDTLAFRSSNGARTMYLDRDAFQLFLEGARRADDVYRPKHLVMGFVAVSVKDIEILKMIGPDPPQLTAAVIEL